MPKASPRAPTGDKAPPRPRSKFYTPDNYAKILTAARELEAEGKPPSSRRISKRTGLPRDPTIESALVHGWKDTHNNLLPWAPPIHDVLASERLLAQRIASKAQTGLPVQPQEDPSVQVAREHLLEQMKSRPPASPEEAVETIRLAREVARVNLLLSIKLGQAAMILVDAAESEFARLTLAGEKTDLPKLLSYLHRISEIQRNAGSAARQAIESEIDLLGDDPTKGMDAGALPTPEEAAATIQRAHDLITRRGLRSGQLAGALKAASSG